MAETFRFQLQSVWRSDLAANIPLK